MKLSENTFKKIIQAVSHTHSEEIGCDDCFDQLHTFAEMKLKGKSPEEAMPLVEDHLKRCGDCREEFEVLLEALKAASPSA